MDTRRVQKMNRFILTLALGITTAVNAESLPFCQDFHKSGKSFSEYFQTTPYSTDRGEEFKLHQGKVAARAWYGAYAVGLTPEELDRLAEGLQWEVVETPQGEILQAVNVGFGGGNSATYLFEWETLQLEPMMFIDGVECIAVGEDQSVFHDELHEKAIERAIQIAKDFIAEHHAISLEEWGIYLEDVDFRVYHLADRKEVRVQVSGIDIHGELVMGEELNVIYDRVAFDPEVG